MTIALPPVTGAVLSDIAEPAVAMPASMRVLDLDEWFRRNPHAAGVVVHRAGGTVVIDRIWFERWLTGRLGFGRAVNTRLTLGRLGEVPTVLLPAGTSIAEAAAVVTDESGQTMVSTVGVQLPDGEVMTVGATTLFRALSRDYAFQARHDALTGLPNRSSLMEWVARPDTLAPEITVLYVDLDRFKDINDGLGHAVGDQVLKQFADRLRRIARLGDRVVRLGGDEFAVLLNGRLTPGQARSVAERIVQEAARPFAVTVDEAQTLVTIGASVGVSDAADGPQLPLADLVTRADQAMFQSKTHGRGRVTHFDADLLAAQARLAELRARRHMERRLRAALQHDDGLSVAYQPLAGVASNRIIGAEALARWEDAELGRVSPADFITVAEETGLILDLGRWVLRTACFEAATWPAVRHPDGSLKRLKVTVNVSPVQIAQPSFFREVLAALEDSGLPPRSLCLEITETAVIDDLSATAELLREIRALGVSIALDDFGTGYSSLTMLRDLPADVVKIDKSFIDRVTECSTDSVLTKLVISTAHSLGMRVCAEGVETAPQAEQLTGMGCDVLQGWLISRPCPGSADLVGWLRSRS
ncbi:putative bifunctional diguanylate cyclase/phosphodiesterase [Kineosporia babensis]|uniref:Bifunctional diguanylate cyclase/phosphodiesterase n=1 Tax=Kineosporia babensis TaxID=499548 RepID=A0A9X1NCL1_9ACTN|nr:bifunctional diguanylate cyclase/phosphodiesterase [Kineosporia babensis]MCD5311630.1 bifunctional diguanylate cyclase/phosphodiesterase [Kineosporia babensis]